MNYWTGAIRRCLNAEGGPFFFCACLTNVAAVAGQQQQQRGESTHRGCFFTYNDCINVIAPQNEVSLLVDSWGVSIVFFHTRRLRVFRQWEAEVRRAAGLLTSSTKKLLICCAAGLELTSWTVSLYHVWLTFRMFYGSMLSPACWNNPATFIRSLLALAGRFKEQQIEARQMANVT